MLTPAAATGTLRAAGRSGDCWAGGRFRGRSHWRGWGTRPRPPHTQTTAIEWHCQEIRVYSKADRQTDAHTPSTTICLCSGEDHSHWIKSDLLTALHPIIFFHTETPKGSSTILDFTPFFLLFSFKQKSFLRNNSILHPNLRIKELH